MATQEAKSPPVLMVPVVAEAFVKNYYRVLFANPEEVHKFYEDSSTITRPNLKDGEMSSASTMLGIKEKIHSSEYHSCKAEIESVNAQKSCKDGLIVLVTGFLIGEGEMKRSFMQTFFLARNITGFFVLNDIFKFGIDIDEEVDTVAAIQIDEELNTESVTEVTETSDATPLAEVKKESVQEPEKVAEVKQPETAPDKVNNNGVIKSLPDMKDLVEKKGPVLKEVVVNKEPSTSSVLKQVPKKSYASMLTKVSPVNSPVMRANPVVVVAPSANSYLDKKKPLPHQHSAKPSLNNAQHPRKNNAQQPRTDNPQQPRTNYAPASFENLNDGKSIYVGNLPPGIVAEDLESAFAGYGAVRKDRIQIKTYPDGFCYAFVEFESVEGACKAIEAHNHWFGQHNAYITEKKSTVKVGNGGAGQASVKGEYRNFDNKRRSRENSVEGHREQNGNRGDYGQNRSFNNNRNRNDSQSQNRGNNEFSSQNRWRDGNIEQKVQQNGAVKQAPATSVK